MKYRLLLGLCVFFGASVVSLSFVSAKDKQASSEDKKAGSDAKKPAAPDKKEEGKGGEGDMAAMMEAWAKLAAPGPHHEHLKPLAGKWTYEGTFWMDPAAPPQTDKGNCDMKLVMDGRYLVTHWKGEPSPMSPDGFEGMGTWAYDNQKKKYVTTWIDNMSTMIMMAEGTCDGSGKTFTTTSSYDDPMTGQKTTARFVTTIVSDGKQKHEMFNTGPDGKEMKMFEILCTRK